MEVIKLTPPCSVSETGFKEAMKLLGERSDGAIVVCSFEAYVEELKDWLWRRHGVVTIRVPKHVLSHEESWSLIGKDRAVVSDWSLKA